MKTSSLWALETVVMGSRCISDMDFRRSPTHAWQHSSFPPFQQKPVPLYKVSNPGIILVMDWWLFLNITLGFLNVFMITLIVDLILVLKNVRGCQGRRPLMDRLVCWLKTVSLLPCFRNHGGNEQDRQHLLKK